MNTLNPKWDNRFIDMAQLVASWSKDPTTKVGAVVVNDNRQILAVGYNGFPRGVHDDPERLNVRPVKHIFTAHAERNALDSALTDLRGATIYSTLCPCNECAKSIIQRGITRVVAGMYKDEQQKQIFNYNDTLLMFHEAGVTIDLIEKIY